MRLDACDQGYVGQTKRSILTRFKVYLSQLKYETRKSCTLNISCQPLKFYKHLVIENLKLSVMLLEKKPSLYQHKG